MVLSGAPWAGILVPRLGPQGDTEAWCWGEHEPSPQLYQEVGAGPWWDGRGKGSPALWAPPALQPPQGQRQGPPSTDRKQPPSRTPASGHTACESHTQNLNPDPEQRGRTPRALGREGWRADIGSLQLYTQLCPYLQSSLSGPQFLSLFSGIIQAAQPKGVKCRRSEATGALQPLQSPGNEGQIPILGEMDAKEF